MLSILLITLILLVVLVLSLLLILLTLFVLRMLLLAKTACSYREGTYRLSVSQEFPRTPTIQP